MFAVTAYWLLKAMRLACTPAAKNRRCRKQGSSGMPDKTMIGNPCSFVTRAVLILALLVAAPQAMAVPSFARQTGMACEACHTVYPELTHFGRVFKANGYILTNLKQVRDVTGKKEELLALSQMPPLSIMVQISDTQLKTALPDLTNVNVPGEAQNGSV